MSRVVAIGDERRLAGYALAGVDVRHAPSPSVIAAVWADLPEDAALLVLTGEAYAALESVLDERDDLVWAVVPS